MEEKKFWFETVKQDPRTGARAGIFHTPHGDIETPVYMPVGTQATVKGVYPRDLKEAGAQIVLANTYHLYMRPGDEIVKATGGLHKFMNWDRPILTDSGGFQVFSLAKLNKIKDEGVYFNSHVDGRLHFITPEKAIEIENNLGADIIMAFDQCSEYGADYKFSKAAMERTLKWLDRCAKVHKNEEQALFPIVQGNMFKDLRETSLKESIPYAKHGIAIGGLSVGEPKELMYDVMDFMLDKYPVDVPRYLMGVGSPDCLIEGVRARYPHRAQRHSHDFPRQDRRQKLEIQGRFHAARSRMRLLLLPQLHESLSQAYGECGGNDGRNAAQPAQHHVFDQTHARYAAGDFRRVLSGIYRGSLRQIRFARVLRRAEKGKICLKSARRGKVQPNACKNFQNTVQ